MTTSSSRKEIPAALSPELQSFLVVHQYGMLAVKSPTMISCGMASSRLDQDQAAGEAFGVGDVEFGRVVGPGQRERRVAVRAEGGVGVEPDPPAPAQHADVEVEQRARVAAGEQDREAGDHRGDQERDPQERQNDVVRDGEEPLHQPHPARELRIQLAGQTDRIRGLRRCRCHCVFLSCRVAAAVLAVSVDRGALAVTRGASTGVVDEMVGSTKRCDGVLNPLTISHTPMKTSHRPPGIAWIEFSSKPRICSDRPGQQDRVPDEAPDRQRSGNQLRAVERVAQDQTGDPDRDHAEFVGIEVRVVEHGD